MLRRSSFWGPVTTHHGDAATTTRVDSSPPDVSHSDSSNPKTGLLLDDFEGHQDIPSFWMTSFGAGQPVGGPEAPTDEIDPPREGSRRAARLVGNARRGMELNWHHHFDVGQAFQAVRFWARSDSSAGLTLVVAFTTSMGRHYQMDLAAGRPWKTTEARLDSGWRLFELPFDQFRASGLGIPIPMFGGGTEATVLHFLVLPQSGKAPLDLWIDDVAFVCRGVCP